MVVRDVQATPILAEAGATNGPGLAALLPPDTRRLGGTFDVREAGRRVVRYQMVTFQVMRLLGGWLAKIPEYELKLEIGRHVWQDAQATEALKQRTAELRIPPDADRRLPVELQQWLDAIDAAETPLQFLVGVYRVLKPRACAAMQYHAAATDQVCDAPTVRVLRLIVAELSEQIAWGEAAIQALCADDAERATEVGTWQARLEALLAAAGGLLAGGTPQPSAPDTTPELAMQSVTALPGAQTPRSERLLIAARDARFYIDLSPRVLPEDDDPPELLELEAVLEARRRTSALPAESEQHAPEGERGLPPPVRLAERDARFDVVSPAEQAERMPPPGDDWLEKGRRLMHGMLDNEMHAAEISGRNSYEFPQMPWDFHIDMARVVWDEIRHSEETRKHLEDLGGQVGMYPIVPGNFAYRIQLDLLHRLQDLHRRGELGGLNGLLKSRNTFQGMGDETGARMFDFIQADETRHVAIGNRWVKWLLHDDQGALKTLADEVERQRQAHDACVVHLVKAALGAADESDAPIQASGDEPTPVNVISLRIAGFTDEEIAELVQKGGGNAALE
ncbi:MAG: DUF455 family protein [Chloroflexi bacterium]|nr:DUF455 family protein [Chloroflexota bacterium]